MTDPSAAIKPFPSLLARGKRWDHMELLQRIDTNGSISTAASAMGMSYKAAWQAVESMNNLSEHPVVERQTGGKHGGGTRLTPYGRRVLTAYRRLEKERERVVSALPGGKLVVATVTNESLHELGLAEGKRACALIKASHVILAVPA